MGVVVPLVTAVWVCMVWRAAGGTSQTTACRMAPSLKRRVSDLAPQSARHVAEAVASDGEGPLSTNDNTLPARAGRPRVAEGRSAAQ